MNDTNMNDLIIYVIHYTPLKERKHFQLDQLDIYWMEPTNLKLHINLCINTSSSTRNVNNRMTNIFYNNMQSRWFPLISFSIVLFVNTPLFPIYATYV